MKYFLLACFYAIGVGFYYGIEHDVEKLLRISEFIYWGFTFMVVCLSCLLIPIALIVGFVIQGSTTWGENEKTIYKTFNKTKQTGIFKIAARLCIYPTLIMLVMYDYMVIPALFLTSTLIRSFVLSIASESVNKMKKKLCPEDKETEKETKNALA